MSAVRLQKTVGALTPKTQGLATDTGSAHRQGGYALPGAIQRKSQPPMRTDWCGGLLLIGQKAMCVDARRVAFGNTGAYRDALGTLVGVPIWEFAESSRL